jgi:predicted nucleic acid-binding protein
VRLVVDASVAVKWLIPEEYSHLALKLLKDFAERAVELHAQLLLKYEAYNALRTYS